MIFHEIILLGIKEGFFLINIVKIFHLLLRNYVYIYLTPFTFMKLHKRELSPEYIYVYLTVYVFTYKAFHIFTLI